MSSIQPCRKSGHWIFAKPLSFWRLRTGCATGCARGTAMKASSGKTIPFSLSSRSSSPSGMACVVWMNAPFEYDRAERAKTEPPGFSQLISKTMAQERPVLPAPHQVFTEIWTNNRAEENYFQAISRLPRMGDPFSDIAWFRHRHSAGRCAGCWHCLTTGRWT